MIGRNIIVLYLICESVGKTRALNAEIRLNVFILQSVNSAILAALFISVCFAFVKIFPQKFSFFFLLTIFMSPWITAFTHNLYWVVFAWFLPTFFSCLIFLNQGRKKYLYAVLFYLSVVFKCLIGYEYISSIILLASSLYIYYFLIIADPKGRKRYFSEVLMIGILGTLGFMTALIIHTGCRSDSIYNGLLSVYGGDIKRRTYVNPNNFHGIEAASLANVLDIVIFYITSWYTKLIHFIPRDFFSIYYFLILYWL